MESDLHEAPASSQPANDFAGTFRSGRDNIIGNTITGTNIYIGGGSDYHDTKVEKPVPRIVNIPARKNPTFVERDFLSTVTTKCTGDGARVALVGIGGTGKSQIAIEYAYRVRAEDPKTWVFWIHANDTAQFENGYREIAQVLQIPGPDNPRADILSLVHKRLSDDNWDKWCLIIDNADDAKVLFESQKEAKSLSSFLPVSGNGSVLITSRNKTVARKLVEYDQDILEVGPMTSHEATLLGQKRSVSDLTDQQLSELAKALGYLPLAISQAVAFLNIHKGRIGLQEYLGRLKGPMESDEMFATSTMERDAASSDSRAAVLTFHVTFDQIYRESRPVAELLGEMSLFHHESIWEELLDTSETQQEANNNSRTMKCLIELEEYCLITLSPQRSPRDRPTYSMHPLVQMSTWMWLSRHDSMSRMTKHCLDNLDKTFPLNDTEFRPDLSETTQGLPFAPHFQTILTLLSHFKPAYYSESVADLFWRAGKLFSNTPQNRIDIELQHIAYDNALSLFGEKHKTFLLQARRYLIALRFGGQLELAEEIGKKALRNCQENISTQQSETAGYWERESSLLMMCLSHALRQIGQKEEETVQLASQAFQYFVIHNEFYNIHEAGISLARAYTTQGKYDLAEQTLKEVLKHHHRLQTGSTEFLVNIEIEICMILMRQRQFADAKAEWLEIMPKLEDQSGWSLNGRYYLAICEFELADVKDEAALEPLRCCLKMYVERLGEEHATSKRVKTSLERLEVYVSQLQDQTRVLK